MDNPSAKQPLTAQEREQLLNTLQTRFARHPQRHAGLDWASVQARLAAQPEKLWSLREMERTGGEPDVVGADPATGALLFYDCCAESPAGRRSLCYDRLAWEQRKANRPAGSALEAAAAMGVRLLSEAEYRALQRLGQFDLKTSSWVVTPPDVRQQGGALFMDRRYGQVFLYHNGADSYYAARGFRAVLEV